MERIKYKIGFIKIGSKKEKGGASMGNNGNGGNGGSGKIKGRPRSCENMPGSKACLKQRKKGRSKLCPTCSAA